MLQLLSNWLPYFRSSGSLLHTPHTVSSPQPPEWYLQKQQAPPCTGTASHCAHCALYHPSKGIIHGFAVHNLYNHMRQPCSIPLFTTLQWLPIALQMKPFNMPDPASAYFSKLISLLYFPHFPLQSLKKTKKTKNKNTPQTYYAVTFLLVLAHLISFA